MTCCEDVRRFCAEKDDETDGAIDLVYSPRQGVDTCVNLLEVSSCSSCVELSYMNTL